MKIDEAVKRACEEPTLKAALGWIAIWECERAMAQRDEWKRTGVSTAGNGGGWDTLFEYCFDLVLSSYREDRGLKVLAGALEPGDFYRKVQGTYVYLVLDPASLRRDDGLVYGSAFHGGISHISKDLLVVRCTPDEFLTNIDASREWDRRFANSPKET